MIGKRIKRCLLIFVGIMVFTALAGLLLPKQLAVLTGTDGVVSERVLVPGGQSVGIQMKVKGALIVGVENQTGPQIGDMIVAVNGERVESPEDVGELIGDSGDKVNITVVRAKKPINYEVTPYFDSASGAYKLGFWIKDRIAGIGTLTFYDPLTNSFASLGHGIYEAETGMLLGAKNGNLLHTKVNQIKAGQKGTPGELGGVIYDFRNPMGKIGKNTEFGVYGRAEITKDFQMREPLIMAPKEEVETGKAYILTTIEGAKVEKFAIRITEVRRQRKADSKSLVFEVTDKKLLAASGGIVQGMSGSPIIQNNRIVGAVTHVFVNNPQKGYGIFAQWMVEEIDKG